MQTSLLDTGFDDDRVENCAVQGVGLADVDCFDCGRSLVVVEEGYLSEA